jgi:hypothetical protein
LRVVHAREGHMRQVPRSRAHRHAPRQTAAPTTDDAVDCGVEAGDQTNNVDARLARQLQRTDITRRVHSQFGRTSNRPCRRHSTSQYWTTCKSCIAARRNFSNLMTSAIRVVASRGETLSVARADCGPVIRQRCRRCRATLRAIRTNGHLQ